MGIVKVSSNGKALVFISDEGGVYTVARKIIEYMLAEPEKWKIITLTRMPRDATPGQFKKSPVFGGEALQAAAKNHEGTGLNFTKEKQIAAKPIEDKIVW